MRDLFRLFFMIIKWHTNSHHSSPNPTLVANDSGGIRRFVVRKMETYKMNIFRPDYIKGYTKSEFDGIFSDKVMAYTRNGRRYQSYPTLDERFFF